MGNLVNQTADGDWFHWLKGFEIYFASRGSSEQSQRWYSQKIRTFGDLLAKLGLPIDVGKITIEHLRKVVLYLRQDVRADEMNPRRTTRRQPLSAHTVNGYINAVRAFFRWLHEEEVIDGDPAANLRVGRRPQLLPKVVTEQEVAQLLAVTRNALHDHRDYAMIVLLLETGIRASELQDLKMDQIDWGDHRLRVFGKGSKQREIALGGKMARRVLWEYVYITRSRLLQDRESQWLFCQSNGERLADVYKIVRRWAERAGVTRIPVGPHVLRHTFATSFLRQGGDLESLRKLLGHTSIQATLIYIHLVDDDVQRKQIKNSICDRLKEKGKIR